MNDENLVSEFLLISFYFILRIVQHYNILALILLQNKILAFFFSSLISRLNRVIFKCFKIKKSQGASFFLDVEVKWFNQYCNGVPTFQQSQLQKVTGKKRKK